MSRCVDKWTYLKRRQDDLHASGAFGHHLFSALLCNTQKKYN